MIVPIRSQRHTETDTVSTHKRAARTAVSRVTDAEVPAVCAGHHTSVESVGIPTSSVAAVGCCALLGIAYTRVHGRDARDPRSVTDPI